MTSPVVPTLEPLCHAEVAVAAPLAFGRTPRGERRIVDILGGTVSGALRGSVLAGGADWQLVREDGSTLLEARYTIRTEDDALIYVENKGVRAGPREVLMALAAGEQVDPHRYYFRACPVFETAAPRYFWLNNIVAVCSALRLLDRVILDFYVVR